MRPERRRTMDVPDAFELDAAFEAIPLIEVGERARLRVRIRSVVADLPDEVHVDVRADSNVLLVSTHASLRGIPAGDALAFTFGPPLRDREFEIPIDVYALRTGESAIAARARCGDAVRECEVRCTCEGAAAFDACANRFELFATEACAGAEVAGKLILTNTGNAAASGELRIEGLENVQLDAGPGLELQPAQRTMVALRGFIPQGLADGSHHGVHAFLMQGSGEVMLGTAAVTVRSRPSIVCLLDAGAGEWRLRVRNDGLDSTTLALLQESADGSPVTPAFSLAGLRVAGIAPGETIVLRIASSPSGAPLPASDAPPFPGPRRWRSPRAVLDPGAIRQLQALRGFIRHLWAIGVLCADASDDGSASDLSAARAALRSVFDRLVIKLRMPRYPLHADDVLDRPARETLCRLGAAASGDVASMLDHAASLAAGQADEGAEVDAYRATLRSRLQAVRDDDALIDALSSVDSELDALLDAVLTALHVRMTA